MTDRWDDAPVREVQYLMRVEGKSLSEIRRTISRSAIDVAALMEIGWRTHPWRFMDGKNEQMEDKH